MLVDEKGLPVALQPVDKERLTPGAGDEAAWEDLEATEVKAELVTPGTYAVFLRQGKPNLIVNVGNQAQALIVVGKLVQRDGPCSWMVVTISEVCSHIRDEDKKAARVAEKEARKRADEMKRTGGVQ